MMKLTNLFKRAACIAVAGALLFTTACGGGNSGDSSSGGGSGNNLSAKGRYIETDITPPGAEGQLQIFEKADGGLVCYNRDLTKRWDSADSGSTWVESPGPAVEHPELAGLSTFTITGDGALIVATSNEETHSSDKVYRLSAEGQLSVLPLEAFDNARAEGKNPFISTLKAMGKNSLYVEWNAWSDIALPGGGDEKPVAESAVGDGQVAPGAGAPAGGGTSEGASGSESNNADSGDDAPAGGIMIGGGGSERSVNLYDATSGEVILPLDDAEIMLAFSEGETLYLMNFERNISAYSAEDGSAKDAPKTSIMNDNLFMAYVMSARGGNFYSIDSNGLRRIKQGESTGETLINGASYSFGRAGGMIDSLLVRGDDEFIVSAGDMTQTRLYHYKYDADAVNNPDNTLNIWALEDNATIRAAISEFRKKNPDALVNFEIALDGTSGKTASDALLDLNTRLLAGSGPDVLVLDGAPVENYVSKNMLANLADIVDTDGLYPSLVKSFVDGENMYVLPARAKLPLLLGGKDYVGEGALDKLLADAKNGPDIPKLDFESGVGFDALPEAERPVISFDSWDEWAQLLWKTSSAEIVKNGQLDSDALGKFLSALKTMDDKYELSDMPEMHGAMVAMSTASGTATLEGSGISYAMERAKTGSMTLDSLFMLQFALKEEASGIVPFPGLTSGAWLPYTLTGINSDTKVMPLASEFMNILFSHDVQKTQGGDGLPVREKSLQSQIEEVSKDSDDLGKNFLPSVDFKTLFDSLTTPTIVDTVLSEKILPTALEYCNGVLDLEGAVKKIEQDIKNYLAEQT